MTPARILIVEDEQITAADIEDVLLSLGHEVIGAVTSGEAAIETVRRRPPDLALMDIRLRGSIDGVEAARRLRSDYDVPAIFLTAHADDRTLERAKDAEPLGYVVKPFQQSDLQAAIEMALHKVRLDKGREHQARELASTLDSLGGGVIRVDEVGRIVYMNPAATQWTGWKADEAMGRSLTEVFQLIDKPSARLLDSFTRTLLHQKLVVQLPARSVVRSRDGVERDVAGNVAPVSDGRGAAAGAVIVFGRPPEMEATAKKNGHSRPQAPAQRKKPVEMVVESPVTRDLVRFAEKIARSGATTVLIEGESGVGKDVFARFLHENSKRADQPFVAVNCAAIPETLIESEVFGYEKGAFTDARSQKKGVLDLADGGTVFLDEIGELQPHLQAKLLRVLEDQTFRRLGGVQDVEVDLRIITATNCDLAKAVAEGRFREDLYYRLNVIHIDIPPVRERSEDILPLAKFFIERYNDRFDRTVEGLEPEAAAMLLRYDWPGNVREIRNVIERAMVLEESDRIQPESLTMGARRPAKEEPAPQADSGTSLEAVERSMLEQALAAAGGNQTRAAKILGISRDTLRYRVKKHGIG